MDVAKDDQKGIRVNNVHMAPTVVKVTKNCTYKQAQAAIHRKSQQDEVSKAIRTLFNIGKTLDNRIGIRQPGDRPEEDVFDAVALVELFNQVKNRYAGVMLDRMTRSSTEPNLSTVQSVMHGIYRFNEPTTDNKKWFI